MANFASLNENIRISKEEDRNRAEKEGIDLIARGMDIGGENFWEDFLRIIGDGRGFSAILEINQQKVATWRSKIKKFVTKYEQSQEDDFEGEPKKRRIVSPDDYWEDT